MIASTKKDRQSVRQQNAYHDAMKTKRKTLGQIAYEIARQHRPMYVPWERSCCQAEYEALALVVAEETLLRAKRKANRDNVRLSSITAEDIA